MDHIIDLYSNSYIVSAEQWDMTVWALVTQFTTSNSPRPYNIISAYRMSVALCASSNDLIEQLENRKHLLLNLYFGQLDAWMCVINSVKLCSSLTNKLK